MAKKKKSEISSGEVMERAAEIVEGGAILDPRRQIRTTRTAKGLQIR